MKFASKASVVAAAVLLIATSAFAATNVVGAWKGRIDIDTSKMPKTNNPQQDAQIQAMLAKLKKMVIGLKLNKNKSFSLSATGMDGKPQQAEGTWSQQGNTVTLKITKENGKPATGNDKSQDLTVAPNGKTMVLTPKGGMNQGKIVFVR